jgi:hypothetical protein
LYRRQQHEMDLDLIDSSRTRLQRGGGRSQEQLPTSRFSRDSSATPVRLVQEILAVADRRFGIIIDSDDDCLHMMVTVTALRNLREGKLSRAKLTPPFGSCFFEARFTRLLRTAPERASPQADAAELAASRSRFFASVPVPIRHERRDPRWIAGLVVVPFRGSVGQSVSLLASVG